MLGDGFQGAELDAVHTVAPAGGEVRHHGDGGIGKFKFPRQGRFRHAGHAHDVRAIPLQAVDFRRGFESWPLGRRVHAAVQHGHPSRSGRLQQAAARGRIIGIGKIDMHHRPIHRFVESVAPAPGVINDLVRHQQGARPQICPDATDGGNGNNGRGPHVFEGCDIGPVVHQVGRNGMAVAVARQKQGLNRSDAPHGNGAGRLTIGSTRHLAPQDLQVGQLGQTGTTDDCKHEKIHRNKMMAGRQKIAGAERASGGF